MPDYVNPQITDSVATTHTATVGQAASVAVSLLYQAEAQAFALGMQNAVTAQQNANQIGQAAVAAAVAKILSLVKSE